MGIFDGNDDSTTSLSSLAIFLFARLKALVPQGRRERVAGHREEHARATLVDGDARDHHGS
ncbi:MAG: hypothetical protein Q8Q09_26050 [Deltaproteobacteria bacterium]|nr:hypothetical protein [Deltaproteobacteria bacterium]